MILAETVFIDGTSVGKLLVDANSGQATFQPHRPPSLLPERIWRSVDELRAAIAELYFDLPKSKNPGDQTEAFALTSSSFGEDINQDQIGGPC